MSQELRVGDLIISGRVLAKVTKISEDLEVTGKIVVGPNLGNEVVFALYRRATKVHVRRLANWYAHCSMAAAEWATMAPDA